MDALERGDASLESLLTRRLVIVTGKGGVGKTTVTAALAQLAAKAGKRVLACETGTNPDAPSALQGTFGHVGEKLGVEPRPLAPNIDGAVLTPESGHRAFLRDVLPLGFLADRALKSEPLKRFLQAAPAFAELGVLYRGMQLVNELKSGRPRWDLVVLDAPATGHALAFASLPEVFLKVIPGGPMGRALRDGRDMLSDPARTAVLVTTLPETLPVSEALELVAGLEKSKMRVHGIVLNQLPHDPFSALEHAALKALRVEKGESLLGLRSVGRLVRAQGALEKLRARVGETLITVREHAPHGSLVERVAAELAGA